MKVPRIPASSSGDRASSPTPFGQVIAQASQTEEEILVVECDPHRMEEVRQHWPFLRDRRIDAYGPIVNRWIDQK